MCESSPSPYRPPKLKRTTMQKLMYIVRKIMLLGGKLQRCNLRICK